MNGRLLPAIRVDARHEVGRFEREVRDRPNGQIAGVD
jgi:hypothetical protein